MRVVEVEAVALGHAIETAAIDAKNLCGAFFIAFSGAENRLDMLPLQLFEGEQWWGGIETRHLRLLLQSWGQVPRY